MKRGAFAGRCGYCSSWLLLEGEESPVIRGMKRPASTLLANDINALRLAATCRWMRTP